MPREIKVLVVDDSPTVREFLVRTFDSAPGMKVVAQAASGEAAIAATRSLQPDVVTMDVKMPGIDGLEATRRIMHECPVPIVIVSGIYEDQVAASFQALEAGALAFVRKPAMSDADAVGTELVRTVRLMSEVKVVRRKERAPTPAARMPSRLIDTSGHSVLLVAVGASTGGPAALISFLNALPLHACPPILIVQHIAVGFTEGLVTWLSRSTQHVVSQAIDGETIGFGRVYVAPEGLHMGVSRFGKIVLADTAPESGLRPAVSHLFRSVRMAYGAKAAAVLLSGMGKDGAQELLELRQGGALTFAQDKDSSLIFGMPGEAARLNAAQYVLPPAQIGEIVAAMARKEKPRISPNP
jgi:two-component system chemotaxis response regulator CheB